MARSILDYRTEQEERVLAFYTANPGASWVEAAKALGVSEAEEDRIFKISLDLTCNKDLMFKFDPTLAPSRFWALDPYDRSRVLVAGEVVSCIQDSTEAGCR